jgi:hypothetical protein
MKLTPVVLLMPVFIFYLHRSLPAVSHPLSVAFWVAWFVSALLNFGWGVYVSLQSNFQGFLCVTMGLVQVLSFLLLPEIAGTRV